ncbi:hypothetical protein GWI33_001843 [Rhynchophorus ferrugineus]|uniref:Uncharacterized protein n=1 Tax=Rhynchophorus ferrugineus TaxID=354439 RepID=A0A834LY94_RHYFE|nr:hypothetical protein GWI33_001843 [Rhynchophorus ferrugineus]
MTMETDENPPAGPSTAQDSDPAPSEPKPDSNISTQRETTGGEKTMNIINAANPKLLRKTVCGPCTTENSLNYLKWNKKPYQFACGAEGWGPTPGNGKVARNKNNFISC